MEEALEDQLPESIAISKAKLSFDDQDHQGKGSFGDVYKGEWSPTVLHPITVAIKQLKLKNLPAKLMAGFVQGVMVHSALDHPKIVKLYGVTIEHPYCMVI